MSIIGTFIGVIQLAQTTTEYIQGSTVEDLEVRTNALALERFATINPADSQFVIGVSLAGAGDGQVTTIGLTFAPSAAAQVPTGGPLPAYSAFYGGTDVASLEIERAAARARILANFPEDTPTIVDEQLAGSAKGQFFTGIVIGFVLGGPG
jgi:hypothetical protein